MKLTVNGLGTRMSNSVKQQLAKKGAAFMQRANLVRAAKLAIMPLLALLSLTHSAHAVDLLESGKETVADTFGADSSIAVWIILGEVIFGVITYIKTKNIFMLFGVAVVVVFTTIGFGLAG